MDKRISELKAEMKFGIRNYIHRKYLLGKTDRVFKKVSDEFEDLQGAYNIAMGEIINLISNTSKEKSQ